MTTGNITNIEDAKFMRRYGEPLNTPIIDHGLVCALFTKHWDALTDAQQNFVAAVNKYHNAANPSFALFKKAKKRLRDLDNAMERCDAILSQIEDEGERLVLAYFLSSRAVPFLHFWQDVLATIEGGSQVEMNINDMPIWFDHE